MGTPEIIAIFHPAPHFATDFKRGCWLRAHRLPITQNWRGEPAPVELQTTAMVSWSEEDLLFAFECAYTELDIDHEFDARQERYGLWDRDVCEAFVRSPLEPRDEIYREFEVAPTGQWCDLIVDRSRKWSDWEWRSGMRTAGEISESEKVWRVVMAIPFAAFGCKPQAGDIWKANLFRISRLNGERQYLSLSPTFTEIPNFHAPGSFIDMRFID